MRRFTIILAILAISFASRAEEKPKQGRHLFILCGQSNMSRLDPKISFIPAVEKAFGKENVTVLRSFRGTRRLQILRQDPGFSRVVWPVKNERGTLPCN